MDNSKIKVLAESDLKTRIIIIGDVHGCYDELILLLTKCNWNPQSDTVILVGDLVSKGPKSAEVIKFVYKNKFYSVQGNVDCRALLLYSKLKSNPLHDWGEFEWIKLLTANEISFIENLPLIIRIPHLKILIVHAGIIPNIELTKQNRFLVQNMRNIYNNEKQLIGSHQTVLGEPWAKSWKGPEHIYFGHDAVRKLQREEFATGLDTGCCYGGSLSAILLPENSLISVKAAKSYCGIKNKSITTVPQKKKMMLKTIARLKWANTFKDLMRISFGL